MKNFKFLTLLFGCFFFSSTQCFGAQNMQDTIGVSDIKNKFLDIPYANISNSQKLDIYLPQNFKKPLPAVILIHGGAWLRGDKREKKMGVVIPQLLKHGYAAVSINYRLSNEAIFPAAVQDTKAAIRFIRANAKKYHINPNKLAVFGGSAGANLASIIGTTNKTNKFDNYDLGYKGVSSEVKAVVALYPPCDLLSMDKGLKALNIALNKKDSNSHDDANSPASRYMGVQITKIPQKVKEANPITYIDQNAPAFLIAHGTMDSTVPFTQSVIFVNELYKKSKNKIVFLPAIGAQHGDPVFFTPKYMNKIFNFLDSVLK